MVIIINGAGGTGKDTICDIVSKHYHVRTVSTIDPIKKMATEYGGWINDKSLAGRKLLSTLKQAFIEYNDLPTTYVTDQLIKFFDDPTEEILFVHIREPQEIDKFKQIVSSYSIPCYTLLIMSKRVTVPFGNCADDNVTHYQYDFIYNNDVPESDLEHDFMLYFELYILNRQWFDT